LDRLPLWLEAVECVLERTGVQVAGKTTSPARALELIEEHQPDLFVSGIETDGDDGLDGITCIKEACRLAPGLRAVVLSAQTEDVDKALQAGAVACVLTTSHPDDLASAVRQAFQHSVYYASGRGNAAAGTHLADAAALDLTGREREILRLVAEGHSNAKLAKMLWVTEQTVKFHLSNVYRKLDVANRTEAARWAQLQGLLTVREDSIAA
jgi:DNA-binding NarL/FixJ family response regulator